MLVKAIHRFAWTLARSKALRANSNLPTCMRIFIIGFMGAGKTWSGRRLAERLGWLFIDLDDLIQTQQQMSIPEIFARFGEDGFRMIEAKALRSLVTMDDLIVATGGGTPCFFENIDWMNAHGVTVYLKTPIPLLVSRLSRRTDRPLLARVPADELEDFIRKMMDRRRLFYEQAQFIIPVRSASDDPVSTIIDLLGLRDH